MMTRPRLLLLRALACAVLAAALPAAAGAAWTDPQDLGRSGFEALDTALASNARGDAVAVFTYTTGISIARASAGQPFGASIEISATGREPRVAIDERGVALIAYEYFDSTFEAEEDRGSTFCCVGTKVVVWRPGHAPTRPRVLRRRGLITHSGPVAASRGRRGVLIDGSNSDKDGAYQQSGTLQFVPVRLDGRPGRRRTVTRRRWSGATLQYVGGRAVVGLISAGGPARLAVRRQRRAGSFGALRVFLRLPMPLYYSNRQLEGAEILMTPDGRGGQIAVWPRGRRPRLYLQLGRKPLGRRLRTITVRRGPAEAFELTAPAVSPDGWIAAPFARAPSVTSLARVAYLLAVRPDGRAIVTRLTTVGDVGAPVASVTRGGAGAVGIDAHTFKAVGFSSAASFIPLAGGRPRPAEALVRAGVDNVLIQAGLMTSNPRDRARALWEENGRVLASRLP